MPTLAETIFDALPVAAGVHDAHTWLASNEAMRDVLGASGPEDIAGRPISDFVHSDGLEAGVQRRELLMKRGQRFHGVTVKMRRVDGTPLSVSGSGVVLDLAGTPVVIVAECAVDGCPDAAPGVIVPPPHYVEGTPLIDAVLDSFPAPIVAVRHGIVMYTNRAGAALVHARTPSDILGMNMYDLVHPATIPSLMQQIALVLNQGARLTAPVKFRPLDGDTVAAEGTAIRINYEGERYAIGIATRILG